MSRPVRPAAACRVPRWKCKSAAKAPDALLIIGTAESSLGDNPAARKTLEELIAKYPASEAAEKAKGRLAKLK